MPYTIHRARSTPPLDHGWDAPIWNSAETLDVALFHAKSTDHHPRTHARVLYDPQALYVTFRVQDRCVRAVAEHYLDMVCRDSCVEFFVKPKDNAGYFNFEMNCGGVLLLYFIEDATIVKGGFKKYQPVEKSLADTMRVYHSMPERVPDEIQTPVTWQVGYTIPFSLFEHHVGPLGKVAGQTWRANFFKCADSTSHPHWASWAPIGEPLNFHKPDRFSPICFEP